MAWLNKRHESAVKKARIVIDPRDASKDQFVNLAHVQQLEHDGLITWDYTNRGWCTADGKPLPTAYVLN